jgi:hypothetical protein
MELIEKDLTQKVIGLLMNFGGRSLEWKRMVLQVFALCNQ